MTKFENENVQKFAEACVDANSIDELLAGFDHLEADATDCKTWGITPAEWMDAIKAATAEKIRIWASENECSELLKAIATWKNCPLEKVEIGGEGDIAVGNKWLDDDGLITFYRWNAATYGEAK